MKPFDRLICLFFLGFSFLGCLANEVRYGDIIILRRDSTLFDAGGFVVLDQKEGGYFTGLRDRYFRPNILSKRIDLKYSKSLIGDDGRWMIVHPDPSKQGCTDNIISNQSVFLLRNVANNKIYIGHADSDNKNSFNPVNESSGNDKQWMFVIVGKQDKVKNVMSEGYLESFGGDLVAIKNIQSGRLMRGHDNAVNTQDKIRGSGEKWWISIQPK